VNLFELLLGEQLAWNETVEGGVVGAREGGEGDSDEEQG